MNNARSSTYSKFSLISLLFFKFDRVNKHVFHTAVKVK